MPMITRSKRMLVTLTEVYETKTNTNNMNASYKQDYHLREVAVNPSHVVYIREDTKFQSLLSEGKLPDGLDSRQSFSRVTIDKHGGYDLIVVGGVRQVQEKLGDARQLLQG